MTRYAIVQNEKIVGCVNWDGVSEHPFGDVDLRGPVPEDAGLEDLIGKRWQEPSPIVPAFKLSAVDEAREFAHADAPARMTAADLLDTEIPWFKFKAEAKRILGNDMPEKKLDIIAALRFRVGNPA